MVGKHFISETEIEIQGAGLYGPASLVVCFCFRFVLEIMLFQLLHFNSSNLSMEFCFCFFVILYNAGMLVEGALVYLIANDVRVHVSFLFVFYC